MLLTPSDLPLSDAPTVERKAVAKLAQQAQQLHTQRRQRVEESLRDIGINLAQSSSRNPLEQPWTLTKEELQRRCGVAYRIVLQARDETAALTEEIAKVELEIDERVAGL
jgi:hypothetical protein